MRTEFQLAVATGFIWGLGEAAVRLSTKAICPGGLIGSVLTGAAFFFFFFGRAAGLRPTGLVLIAVAAAVLKVGTSLAVGIPLIHGAVWNPVFAYSLEAGAFLAVIAIAGHWAEKTLSRTAVAGAVAALLAAMAFPLSGSVTGFAACVQPGSGLPASWAYAYVAVIAAVAVSPLGLAAGKSLERHWRLQAERPSSRHPIAIPAATITAGLLTFLLAFLEKHGSS